MPRYFPNPVANLSAYAPSARQEPRADANGDYEPTPHKMPGTYHAILDNNAEEWGFFTRWGVLASGVDPASGLINTIANGGTAARFTAADMLAYVGEFFHSGLAIGTGTTSNATGVSSFSTFVDGLVGLPTPTAANGTVYEFETYFVTGANVPSSGTNGYIAIGFLGAASTVPTNGMWLEFRYDGTTNDTTWHWVNRKDGGQNRTACTGTSLATTTYYYLKLKISRATNGDVTQTWTINGNTGTITTLNADVGTATIPTDATSGTGDAFGIVGRISKAGSATATSNPLYFGFAAARIRREFTPSYRATLWQV